MPTAYLFPGQGSQQPGMGEALYNFSPAARQRFQQADDLLGFPLSSIMREGSAEELQRTSVTQPAIFVHSVVLAEQMNVREDAAMAAGHSLGEFSALAALGAIDFEDGLTLVRLRSEAMQMACDKAESTMAAVIGLEDDAVEGVCGRSDKGVVVAANFNAPGQVVISGDVAAVKQAMQKAKNNGAKMVKQLDVNGAFHSPLMEPARHDLAQAIQDVAFSAPIAPVYQNATAVGTTDPDTLKRNLVAQLTAPVRWRQSVEQMIRAGASNFIELGPGKVLQGLVKRIDRSVTITGYEAP